MCRTIDGQSDDLARQWLTAVCQQITNRPNLIPGLSPKRRGRCNINLLIVRFRLHGLQSRIESNGSRSVCIGIRCDCHNELDGACRIDEDDRGSGRGRLVDGPSCWIANGKTVAGIGGQMGGRCRVGLSSRRRITTRRAWCSSGTSTSQAASSQQEHQKEATQAQDEPGT